MPKHMVALLLLVLAPAVFALNISIDNEYFYPGVSAKTLLIHNSSDAPLAVEVAIGRRVYSRDGVEDFSETYPGLLAIPGQMIIGAHQEQVVTLQQVSAGPDGLELPLRLVVETVPINLSRDNDITQVSNGGLKLVYRVVRSLYLSPKNVFSNVGLQTIALSDSKHLKVTLVNDGNAHQIMYGFDVVLADGASLSVNVKDLNGGINMLPRDSRDIIIPLPDNWSTREWRGAKLQNIIF